MKITESIEVVNENKTIAGHKDLRITLDTDTGRLVFDAPAMFVDPVVSFDKLQDALNRLSVHQEKADGQV